MTDNQTEAVNLALDAVKLIIGDCPLTAEVALAEAIALLKKDHADGLPELRPVSSKIARMEIAQ